MAPFLRLMCTGWFTTIVASYATAARMISAIPTIAAPSGGPAQPPIMGASKQAMCSPFSIPATARLSRS